MKLLALLIVLALRRIEWRRDATPLADGLRRVLLWPAPLAAAVARTAAGRLLVTVVAWVVVGFLLRFGVDDWLLSLPLLAVYTALLWWLVGPDRLGRDLNEYLRLWYLEDRPGLPDFVRERFGIEPGAAPETLHRQVLEATFVRAFRESLGWVIVFAVAGLPGLLLMATLDAARRDRRDPMLAAVAAEMAERLDWLLARLLGLSLLLTGHSARVWSVLDNRLLDDTDPASELASAAGIAGAGFPLRPADAHPARDIADARALLLRTKVLWVLLMAISVIIGF